MLHVPGQPEFLWYLSSQTGRPNNTTWGTSVVPGTNAYGTYTELLDGALVTEDVWWIRIHVHTNAVSAEIRDTLLTVGIDPAAGTSYVDKLTHLLVSAANLYVTGGVGGVWYDFRYRIPAGSSIAVKASVNNAVPGTLLCWVQLWGRPRHPESTWAGSIFRSFGEVTATSRGTLVTPGTTSDGTWTQLGSATAEELRYWEFGYGINDATIGASLLHADIGVGDATTKRPILNKASIIQTGGEAVAKPQGSGRYARVAVGDLVYGRLQNASPNDTDHSLIAYGVG